MRLAITHTTTYRYNTAARAIQSLRLTPSSGRSQNVLDWQVSAAGLASATRYVDAFGNMVDLVASHGAVDALEIVARGVVETNDTAGVVGFTGEAVVADVFLRTTRLTAPDAAISAFAEACRGAERLPTLHAMLDALHEQVGYDTTTTGSATTAAEAFADKRGVCQDHAHIFIAAARVLGIPARYVTGYLLVDAGEDSGTGAGDGASAVAHHAWAEALVADIGWIGFDPSNGQCPTDRYVRLAVGLDAAMAAPIRGVHAGAARESLDVAVDVRQSQSQSQKQQ